MLTFKLNESVNLSTKSAFTKSGAARNGAKIMKRSSEALGFISGRFHSTRRRGTTTSTRSKRRKKKKWGEGVGFAPNKQPFLFFHFFISFYGWLFIQWSSTSSSFGSSPYMVVSWKLGLERGKKMKMCEGFDFSVSAYSTGRSRAVSEQSVRAVNQMMKLSTTRTETWSARIPVVVSEHFRCRFPIASNSTNKL